MLSTPLRRALQSPAARPGSRLGAQPAARYFVKPKKKKGPSGQALATLAGVTAVLSGVGLYALGEL